MPDVVAIHQPNFLPWLGYFDKIARADTFVFLDDVQYPRTGAGNIVNRVKLLVGGTAKWQTVPLVRDFEGVRLIREMRIDDAQPWRRRMLDAMRQTYRRAPHFAEVFAFVEPLLLDGEADLAAFNMRNVRAIASWLGLRTDHMVCSSALPSTGQATERLLSIVRAVSGTTYLCGGGASGYQQDELFAAAGLGLVYQRFQHPVYPQHGTTDFVPGLSIVDALMNCGRTGTRAMIDGSPSAG